MKQDKITINSWDITYHEQLKKFENKTARFVVEEVDDVGGSGDGSKPRMSRPKRNLFNKKRTSSEF
jgi:hypothetical protein